MVYLPSWGVTRRVSRVRHPVPLCSGKGYYSRYAINGLLAIYINFINLSDELNPFSIANCLVCDAEQFYPTATYCQTSSGQYSFEHLNP